MGQPWLQGFTFFFECDWLIELSDNKLSNNKLSDNNLENRSFSNQSQSRKLGFFMIKLEKIRNHTLNNYIIRVHN